MNNFDKLSFNKIQESVKLHETVIKIDKLIHAKDFFNVFSPSDIKDLKNSREEIKSLIKNELAEKLLLKELWATREERETLLQELKKGGETQKETNKKLNETVNRIEIIENKLNG